MKTSEVAYGPSYGSFGVKQTSLQIGCDIRVQIHSVNKHVDFHDDSTPIRTRSVSPLSEETYSRIRKSDYRKSTIDLSA
jgi:hypothetical protein